MVRDEEDDTEAGKKQIGRQGKKNYSPVLEKYQKNQSFYCNMKACTFFKILDPF